MHHCISTFWLLIPCIVSLSFDCLVYIASSMAGSRGRLAGWFFFFFLSFLYILLFFRVHCIWARLLFLLLFPGSTRLRAT